MSFKAELGHRLLQPIFWGLILTTLSSCGFRHYPGQPGIVTDGYSKISYEMLSEDGLFIYETTYDNRPGKAGVESVVTKLHPGARTYTSNARTNFHGTKYITKDEYLGAVVQMIYLPPTNELILPSDSKVMVIVDNASSMDEVDHSNKAEQSMFQVASRWTGFGAALSRESAKFIQTKFNLLRAGKMDSSGRLTYTVTKVQMGSHQFVPNRPITVQTNLTQSGVLSSLTEDQKQHIVSFIETHFPKGFSGEVQFFVTGSPAPISFLLGLNTVRTLENKGARVRRVSRVDAEKWLQRARHSK